MKVRESKRHGNVTWELDLGVLNGRRQRRFFKTKEEAEECLRVKAIQVKELGETGAAVTTKEWSQYFDWKTALAELDVSFHEVVKFYRDNHHKLIPRTISEAIVDRITYGRERGDRDVSVEQTEDDLKNLLSELLTKQCREVTRDELDVAIKKDTGALTSPWTINTRISRLKAFFNFCISRRYLLTSPADHLVKVNTGDAPPPIFNPFQIKSLLDAAAAKDPDVAAYLSLITFGGLRPSEAEAILPEHIKRDHIEVPKSSSKTRARRLVVLTPTLKAWLKVGKPFNLGDLKRRVRKVRDAAAIKKIPHDCLRHSFCSYAVAHYGARWASEQAGHSETILFKHYREVVTKAEARRFWGLRP